MENVSTVQYIESIKLAYGSVQYKGLPIKETFFKSIDLLKNHYEETKNIRYLEVALLHIQAYLEMGFPYEQGESVFAEVLRKLGTTRESEFPRRFYASSSIKLNKSQVRSMIRKWPASPYQKMKIDEVVADIIQKVQKKQSGIYYYQCAVTKEVYELTIQEEEIFFYDVSRGLFYTFLEDK